MGRLRKGCVIWRDGIPYARIQWTDENGKRQQRERRAENKTHANQLIKRLLREHEDQGQKFLDAERMTFADLAEHYRKTHLVPAEYADGRKIAGLRSLSSAVTRWEAIKEYFGKKRLRTITYGDLERFRHKRINTLTIHGKSRSVTSVNRELEVLRNMLNVAYREGWIIKNPFSSGPPLIQKAFEKKRERILTREEEAQLLAACVGRRAHLRPIVIMALDTGMRKGEILTLSWQDIDFEKGLIKIQAFHTKTQQERTLKMTPRLEQEIIALYQSQSQNPECRIFGIVDNVKKSFNSACKVNNITKMRFHDLRHTFATRLIREGVSQAEVSRILGHNNTRTTDRYINIDLITAQRVAEVLATFSDAKQDPTIITH